MSCHPLDPASPEELKRATDFVKSAYEGITLQFKAAGLQEPDKADMVAYLDAEHNNKPLPSTPRCVSLIWYIKRTPRLFEAIVDVTGPGKFVHHVELPRDFHGPVDRAEMNEAAQAVLDDPRVQAEIKRLKIDDTIVVLDPWDYGVDGKETQTRHTQVTSFLSSLSL
jgi:primary-amine oxidase